MTTTKLKLTGLWKNQDKNGETYLAGNLTPTARLVIFPNGFKNGDRDPDLIAYLVPAEKKLAPSADSAK